MATHKKGARAKKTAKSRTAKKVVAANIANGKAHANGGTKLDIVLTLLKRREGVTLAQIGEVVKWKALHAPLVALRKRGHVISSEKRDVSSPRVYHVES